MKLSLPPILLAVELGFLFAITWRSGRRHPAGEKLAPTYLYLLWISAYGAVTSVLGAHGVFVSDALLRTLPGLWLQLVTVLIAVVPVALFGGVRNSLRRIVDITPWHWFAYFHALRIAALGTAYKTLVGEFPVYFEWFVGVPDLLFGFSALWVARLVKRGEFSAKRFMVWNFLGALVIVPSAPILLQLGLPGPLQLFTSQPDARVVFTYPMSIAPIIGVPLFVLINLGVALRLWERRNEAGDR